MFFYVFLRDFKRVSFHCQIRWLKVVFQNYNSHSSFVFLSLALKRLHLFFLKFDYKCFELNAPRNVIRRASNSVNTMSYSTDFSRISLFHNYILKTKCLKLIFFSSCSYKYRWLFLTCHLTHPCSYQCSTAVSLRKIWIFYRIIYVAIILGKIIERKHLIHETVLKLNSAN
jgi:hypothetical protein